MEIPCEGCITLPICRHKKYGYMMQECDLLRSIIYNCSCTPYALDYVLMSVGNRRISSDKTLVLLENILQPSQWKTEYSKLRGRQMIKHKEHIDADPSMRTVPSISNV